MTEASTIVGHRRCLACECEIRTSIYKGDHEPNAAIMGVYYIAWLGGYCHPMCQRKHALEMVESGRAWWMRGGR